MNALVTIEAARLPALIRSAASKLAAAETSAEILDARDEANLAYHAAKAAGRIARAKQAHDEVITAVYRAQADALEIESMAKRRLADEYDAAQKRGEVRSNGERSFSHSEKVGPSDLGLDGKEIYEARAVRDAEAADPGITRRALDGIVERGDAPTKSALQREIAPLGHLSDDELLTELEYRGSAINADAVHLVFHSFFVIEKFCAEYPGDLANKIRPFLLRTPDEAIERAAA